MTSADPSIDLDRLTTPLVHLYRGELGRMTSYRGRLDTTTNWAIGTNAALLSLVLGEGGLGSSALLPVALAINLMFVAMEARRYRGFELIRARVRLLERGLYARVLAGSDEDAGQRQSDEGGTPDWVRQLRESLETPAPPLSYLAAASIRLRRGYLWLIGISYLAWGLRVSQGPGVELARIGPLPPVLVISVAALIFVGLVGLSLAHRAPEEG